MNYAYVKAQNKAQRAGGLSDSEFMLSLLGNNPSMTQAELADEMGKSRRSVQTLMKQLTEEGDIVVTIPFNWINQVGNNVGDKVGNNSKPLSQNRQTIIAEMRNNPSITKAELSRIIGISTTAIDKNISFLKTNGYIERIGSNKTGYWKVCEIQ